MNFLIFCGYLGSKLNANNKIASIIAEQIANKGHNVTIAGITTDENSVQTKEFLSEHNCLKTIHITPNEFYLKERAAFSSQLSSEHKLLSAVKYTICHPLSAAKAIYSYTPFIKLNDKDTEATNFLNRYCKNNHIDCIIAVVFPKFALPVVFNCNTTDCLKVIYQLDPIGLHDENSPEDQDEQQKLETHYFSIADHIFTTKLLKESYSLHPAYCSFSDKITCIEFPTLIPFTDNPVSCIELPKNKTNIVFCGTINDSYRSPEKFLRCMEKIWEHDDAIAVHFVGINQSDICNKYAKLYPHNIFNHPRIDTKYVSGLLSDADILLNIGNSLPMQLPSKIFEYFATGKPIIHQQIIDNCSCKAYMDRYPLAFSLNDVSNATADKMYMFIKDAAGQSLAFNHIEQLFSDSTPQNAAEKMLNILTAL